MNPGHLAPRFWDELSCHTVQCQDLNENGVCYINRYYLLLLFILAPFLSLYSAFFACIQNKSHFLKRFSCLFVFFLSEYLLFYFYIIDTAADVPHLPYFAHLHQPLPPLLAFTIMFSVSMGYTYMFFG